jgi:hypothetical protein
MEWTAFTAVKRNSNGKFQKQGPKRKGKCYNCGKEKHFAAKCRSANKVSFSEEPRKSKKNKGKQRKEKVHELRGKKKERDENPGSNPVYFYLLKGGARGRGRKEPGLGNSIFSDPPSPFRITENFPKTAQNLEIPSKERCTNPAYQVWEQAQAKLEADLKEYQQINTNLVASLAEVTKDKATQRGASEKHEIMSWTACYDDQCRIHLSEKEGAGWFSQGKIVARSLGRHKGKGKALVETWDSILIRGKGRSISPEND